MLCNEHIYIGTSYNDNIYGMISSSDYTCSCQTLHAYRGTVSGNCMLLGLRNKNY